MSDKKSGPKSAKELQDSALGELDKVLQELGLRKGLTELALQTLFKAPPKKESLTNASQQAYKQWKKAQRTLNEALPEDWQLKKLRNKPLDELIEQVGEYLNEKRKADLDKAYQAGDYSKAVTILCGFYGDLKKASASQRKEGATAMSTVNGDTVNAISSGNPPLLFIMAILVLAIVALSFLYLKKLGKASTEPKTPTEQEKDFLELIRLLAAASDKTDEYLKS